MYFPAFADTKVAVQKKNADGKYQFAYIFSPAPIPGEPKSCPIPTRIWPFRSMPS